LVAPVSLGGVVVREGWLQVGATKVRVDETVGIVCYWGPRVRQQDGEGALSQVVLRWEWFTVTRLALTDVCVGRFSVLAESLGTGIGEDSNTHCAFLFTYSDAMSSSLSNSEEPTAAQWNAHCRAVKKLYRATQAVFVGGITES
jgi:hypothetical protein